MARYDPTISDCVIDANRVYRRAVLRESSFWKKAFEDGQKAIKKKYPSNLSGEHYEQLKKRYDNIRLTGSPQKSIIDLLKSMGPFKRALSLGAGSAEFEFELLRSGIISRLDIVDFSTDIGQITKTAKKESMLLRISVSSRDLNFIELEEDKYDLIICRNILHHLVNLEHILYQANKALAKNGVLFVEDYIGENKFQWAPKREEFIRSVSGKIPAKINKNRLKKTEKALLNYVSPFEAIRSEDIPAAVNLYFRNHKIKEVRYGEVAHLWEVLVDPHQDIGCLDKAFAMLSELDLDYSKKHLLRPTRIIGLYHKNHKAKQAKVRRWGADEIKDNLGFSFFCIPVLKQILRKIKKTV